MVRHDALTGRKIPGVAKQNIEHCDKHKLLARALTMGIVRGLSTRYLKATIPQERCLNEATRWRVARTKNGKLTLGAPSSSFEGGSLVALPFSSSSYQFRN